MSFLVLLDAVLLGLLVAGERDRAHRRLRELGEVVQ